MPWFAPARLGSRALQLVAQALGVVLLLFLILESGLAGDPAERALGDRPSLQRLGALRVELGFLRSFREEAVDLQLEGPRARWEARGGSGKSLVLSDHTGERARLALRGLTLEEACAALEAFRFESGHQLQARLRDPALAALPASGLLDALHGTRLALDTRRGTAAPWAEARPGWARFLHQTGELLRFDFGRSLDGQPIGRELSSRVGRSLALAVPGFVFSTLLAVLLALQSVRHPHGRIARLSRRASLLVLAVSGVSWILLWRGLLASQLGWFPLLAWDPPGVLALLLPVLIWVFLATWPDFELYRRVLEDSARAPHVLGARARGLPDASVWRRHVLRPAAGLWITQLALALPFLVLGSVLLEQVFVVPGLGDYLVSAARNADAAVLRATTFLFALLYLVLQALGDWSAARFDPRLRAPEDSGGRA